MREFKVSEVEKTAILKELNEKLEYYQRISERDDDDIEQIQSKIVLLKQEEAKLKEDGIVSQRLFRLIDTDIKIELTSEMQDTLLQDMTKDTREWLEEEVKSGSIKWRRISGIYDGNSILENADIPLDSRAAEILLQMKRNASVSWETEDREYVDGIVTDIKQGKIKYKDFLYLMNKELDSEDRDENSEFTSDVIYQYNKGDITEEEMLKSMASPSNKALESYMQKYLANKRYILENSVDKIFETYEKLSEYGIYLKSEQQETFEQLLFTMDHAEIDKKDIDVLEKFVDSYNDLANDVWKDYLDGQDKFLIHATRNGINGKFKDANMSTSLISFSGGLTQTYGDCPIGYQVKPRHISKADSRDVYVLNSREDRYAASGTYRAIDIKLPQIVERETLEKAETDDKALSEIVVDDFEIESVVILTRRVPERDVGKNSISILSTAEELSEKQSNIPIKIIGPEGLITLQEAQELEDRENFKNNVTRAGERISVNTDSLMQHKTALREKYKELGLKDNLTDYSEVKMVSEKLVQDMQGIDSSIHSQDKIDSLLENMNHVDGIFRELKGKEFDKYRDAVGEKVNLLISQAKKANLENEKAHIEGRKVGFVQRLFGGNKLKEAQLKNIELRQKLIKPEDKKYKNFTEMTETLLESTKENGITPEILDFVEKFSKIQGFESGKQMEATMKIKKLPRERESKALEPSIGITKISEEVNKVLARNIELEGKLKESRVASTEELCERLEKNSPLTKFKEIANKTREILELDTKGIQERSNEKQTKDMETEK